MLIMQHQMQHLLPDQLTVQSTNQTNKLLKILVIDDHESVLNGTIYILRKNYPSAEFITATDVQTTVDQVTNRQPDLIVMDLSIPERQGMTARTDNGIQLLKTLMKQHPHLNIVVQSAHSKTLVRIRLNIDSHQGGFTIANKSVSIQEMLTRVDWALQGLTHTKDIKGINSGTEVKPEWLKVLYLAFERGLQIKPLLKKCVFLNEWCVIIGISYKMLSMSIQRSVKIFVFKRKSKLGTRD
ncbi:MAG: hypothetical protein RLZZ29_920 [Cyanobacteriota bacterium]